MIVRHLVPVLALAILLPASTAACGGARPDVGEESVAATNESATVPDRESSAHRYLVRAAATHVLVIDGTKVPPAERVATARRLDPADFESIEFLGADDPRARELIGEERGKTGAIVIVTKGADRREGAGVT